tara:strand:- start:220 stop:579 length:360 start_codon:yes stop_codon:yes gene_type:complete
MTNNELDTLMAVEVRNLKPHQDIGGGVGLYLIDEDSREIYVTRKCGRFPIWTPTTDMDQAMECVEALPDDIEFGLMKHPASYGCSIQMQVGNEWQDFYGEDKSAPLAICLAIEKAIERS